MMTDSTAFQPGAALPALSPDEMARRLGRAIQFPTISYEDPARFDHGAFSGLHGYLETAFPCVHATLTRETAGRYSALYTWPGRELSLEPILLAGHLDVVPIEAATERDWTCPPFSGAIDDGFVWGRGSLDDKDAVLGILEATEALLGAGFTPRRTVLFAFGEDEEVGGLNGAARAASLLQARGVRPAYVLDEGLAVIEGVMPIIRRPVAMIGIAEKGYLTLELSVEVGGGHSSMPPRETAIGILSAAIVRLERHPMPARLAGPAAQMLARLASEMPPGIRLVMSHQRLFGPLIARIMARSPSTAASIRTTSAATIIQAGVRENVLPSQARAVVNLRLLPGDTISAVIERVRRTIDDPRVRIADAGTMRSEASPVAETASPGFRAIEQAIASVFPGVAIVPALVMGATDSRHYAQLGCPCYRFSPLWVRGEDLDRMHGVNERIAVDHYARAVRFYMQLISAA